MKCIIQLAYNSVQFTTSGQYILGVRKKKVIKSPPRVIPGYATVNHSVRYNQHIIARPSISLYNIGIPGFLSSKIIVYHNFRTPDQFKNTVSVAHELVLLIIVPNVPMIYYYEIH